MGRKFFSPILKARSQPTFPYGPRQPYLLECSYAHTKAMEKKVVDPTDRCVNGRCWVGPILIAETRGGAVADLQQWIKITLSRHHNKETTLGLMSCLDFTHLYEEHAIMAFAIGREPHASALREVYVRMKVDHGGVLRSNCSTYHFSIAGEGEQKRCDALISHYDWLDRVASRYAP